MSDTSARLLRLLSLLQAHRESSGAELAARLGVTTRTVRRDVERLRDLGYPVHAVRGTAGYQLGAGAALPPLLLDDDEAVAVTLGLRHAAEGSVTGLAETALRALRKLEQVLPPRLRYRVQTLQAATARLGGPAEEAELVSSATLMTIADACRRQERLRFDYRSHGGESSARTGEPHRLINAGRRWYLVAWDVDRADWRSFRVDRMTLRTPAGPRFAPRPPPDGDAVRYLANQLSSRTWPCRAVFRVYEPAAAIGARIWPGMGVVEAEGDRSCLVSMGADSTSALVWMITSLDADFAVVSGEPAVTAALRSQAARCEQAARSAPTG
ncbi:transcriptional regulator [Natronosporangium hydrolyticum]|uniref:Transcriptional regulator n=1 Tax=Natronosporangium hydrolyticum TaxID=2811111 RepID=A0A895YKS6_9ACTN|nr:transcriptional regulator [Natronosporangium hydrolyticum]QSB16585.1 transcriptional regulator [Natronosporangium hydrolyticum]